MSQPNVVIIEDDIWLAEQHMRVLQQAGYHPHHATYASAAIELIDEHTPIAIVLDVLLTGSTAMVLLHELQSYKETSAIPVILCTNMASEISLSEFEPYGVRRILDKSTMLPDDLIAAIRSVTL